MRSRVVMCLFWLWASSALADVTLYLPEDELAALNADVLQHSDLLPEERRAAQSWLDSGLQSWPGMATWMVAPCNIGTPESPVFPFWRAIILRTERTADDLVLLLRSIRGRVPSQSEAWVRLGALIDHIGKCATS